MDVEVARHSGERNNLMAKITKILAAVLLTVSPFLTAYAADVYRYSDPLFPAKRLALRISDKQFTVADMAEDLYVCKGEQGHP